MRYVSDEEQQKYPKTEYKLKEQWIDIKIYGSIENLINLLVLKSKEFLEPHIENRSDGHEDYYITGYVKLNAEEKTKILVQEQKIRIKKEMARIQAEIKTEKEEKTLLAKLKKKYEGKKKVVSPT